jgi:hypothetical protein
MPWFILARALFVAAITYAAMLARPFSPSLGVNLLIGAALGVLFVLIETRLRTAEVTDLLGALIGGAIGLGLAKTIGAALFWADTTDARVVFLHSCILLVFPYLGLVMGARKGEWLEPARLVSLFRNAGPQRRYRILDTSVIIDGRIADVCEKRGSSTARSSSRSSSSRSCSSSRTRPTRSSAIAAAGVWTFSRRSRRWPAST